MNLRCVVIDDLLKIWDIWNSLKIHNDLHSLWEYRYHIMKQYRDPIYCFVAYRNDTLVWFLPLFLNSQENKLIFLYPSWYHFENLIKDAQMEVFNFLIDQVKATWLDFSIEWILFNQLPPKVFWDSWLLSYYYIDIWSYNDAEDYVRKNFPWNHKRVILKQMRDIESIGVVKELNHYPDIKKAIDLNLERFGKDSIFYNDEQYIQWHLELPEHHHIHSIAIKYNEKVESVAYGIALDNIFYVINCSSNHSINNLWKYAIFSLIDYAKKLWFSVLDVGAWDSNRKESWKCKRRLTWYYAG